MIRRKVVEKRYRLDRLLGEGSVGSVYLAWDRLASRQVALKCLRDPASTEYLALLREEARWLAQLRHPNLIQIYDFHPDMAAVLDAPESSANELPAGPGFAMEYLPHPSMDRRAAPISAEDFLSFFLQTIQGLHYLHLRGLLHRDLKPSNLMVAEANVVKLLDFGWAGWGTRAYQAPEVYWGDYGENSDLFSLGVLSYELLTGKLPYPEALTDISKISAPTSLAQLRPDLPEFLLDLLHRLLQLAPSSRPSSTAAVLRFLKQHLIGSHRFEAGIENGPGDIRPNWVGRKSELATLQKLWEETQVTGSSHGLRLYGPTGMGRSRLLEEWAWKLRLAGATVHSCGPEDAGRRIAALIAERESLNETKPGPHWIQFTDLHLWTEDHLRQLEIFLALLKSRPHGACTVLEWNEDFLSKETASRLQKFSEGSHWQDLRLGELKPEESIALLHEASLENPLTPSKAETLAQRSGGRPLLALTLLREVRGGEKMNSSILPASLGEAARQNLARLSPEEMRLLALAAVEEDGWSLATMSEVSGWKMEKVLALTEALRTGSWIGRKSGEGGWTLHSASLRPIYLEEISRPILEAAHQDWLKFRRQRFPNAKPDREALLALRHALAVSDIEAAKHYGFAAAQYCQNQNREGEAIELFEKLWKLAATAQERCFIQAQLAPAYYRRSEFEKSLKAYDLWHSEREDDASQLQKLKHRFYTGLAYFGWAKNDEAFRRLEEALQLGDVKKYPSHRPYLIRVHNLLAALHEKKGQIDPAGQHLKQALILAEDEAIRVGEIEQRFGIYEQNQLNGEKAQAHFEKSLASYQSADNAQGRAIAWNSLAMLHLAAGRLAEAWREIQEARAAAKLGRDLLQQARYLENSALIAMAQARYHEALKLFSESRALLEALGGEIDRLLVGLHRLQLSFLLGNREQAARWRSSLNAESENLQRHGRYEDFILLLAEQDLREDRAEAAAEKLQSLFKSEASISTYDRWRIQLAQLRCHWREPSIDPPQLQKGASLLGPEIAALWALQKFFNAAEWSEALLQSTLNAVQNLESPESRQESYGHLARSLKRQNLTRLSEAMSRAARLEWRKIFDALSEELKMDFEKNRKLSDLEENLQKLLQPERDIPSVGLSDSNNVGLKLSEARFRQFSEINRQIAEKTDLSELLERVMDAAIEFTGAERGFLLLKMPGATGTASDDFKVEAARHLSRGSLQQEEFSLSMSAVMKAVETGAYLLTDNARLDPRFQEKKSVVLHQLTSILVVPLERSGEVQGAIYLDHRLQPGCFKQEDILILNAFASQAALAIQKARLLEELRQANKKLSVEVRDQAQHIQVLSGELLEQRDQLRYEYGEIIGSSPQMMKVFQLLDHVTSTTIPVWIWGESGTGKELIARSLHANSPRKSGPFIAENCSAIPENLLESELFGHKRGAFTHADRDRVGLIEQANGGTLFLDEVADMSLAMQAKLLRVFQENEIRPLGSSKKIKIDIRLVTASNRDLAQMAQSETFRQDLFFRINGLTIRLPPLRERKTDIALLVQFLMKKLGKQLGLAPSELSEQAFQAMLNYPWPGNIRELESVLRNALLFSKGRVIGPELLALRSSPSTGTEDQPLAPSGSASGPLPKERILSLLKKHGLDKKIVAQELGISLRSLYLWLEKIGVPKKKSLLAKYLGI